MRGPLVDERLMVRCEWDGSPGASQSVAYLHGREVARNYCNATVRAWERSTSGSATTWHLASFRLQVPGDYYASYRLLNRDAVERSFCLAWWNGAAYQRGPIVAVAPGEAIRVGGAVTISADDALFEARVHCIGVATGEIVTARVDQPHLAAGDQPTPYFDGDTRDPEVLMSLYAAVAEGTPPR